MFPRLMVFRADRDIVVRAGEYLVVNPNGYIENCTPAELAVRLGAVDDIAPPKPVVVEERPAPTPPPEPPPPKQALAPPPKVSKEDMELIASYSQTNEVRERRARLLGLVRETPGLKQKFYTHKMVLQDSTSLAGLSDDQLRHRFIQDLRALKDMGLVNSAGTPRSYRWSPTERAR